jgi:GDP-L-fucose synthase
VARARVFVAGHGGLVGAALVRALDAQGGSELLVAGRDQLDLLDREAVARWFEASRPEHVYVAAAKVGGILANATAPVEFLSENLRIALNVIEAARTSRVARLLFLGSSCIYPREAPQPMTEKALLTGALEPTNEAYAVAKIAGIKLCEAYNREYGTDFRSVMPTNLYGPGDNFDPEGSHVIPGVMRRIHEAKLANAPAVTIWGSGRPRREFLHVDDLARACLHVMALPRETLATATEPMCSHLSVGTGEDMTIADLARLIADTVGYRGRLEFDASKPDGTPRKLLDVSKLAGLGWRARIPLRDGLRDTYAWFAAQGERVRGAA